MSDLRVLSWRQMRAMITEDKRILIEMHNGTKTPPWLELDDAGQHAMIDLIQRAQEGRQ